MAYNYDVKLEIANDKVRDVFDFNSIEPQIKEAIEKYHALNTVRNKKNLSYKISPKILEISISSPVKLDVPSKALAKFTEFLLNFQKSLREQLRTEESFNRYRLVSPLAIWIISLLVKRSKS